MEIDMTSFAVKFAVEQTLHINGIEHTVDGSVELIGHPNGNWSLYDITGSLIEDPSDRCEVFDFDQNPHVAKAVMNWLKDNREFRERADEKVMEEFYDHV